MNKLILSLMNIYAIFTDWRRITENKRVYLTKWLVSLLHYVNTLKQELDGTRAYLETDTDEVSVVNAHLNDLPVKFSVCVNEGQDKLPTMYWLPKLHKRPYKARFIANSSSCTTTELSKLLTSCLTAIKSHVIRYCETVYEISNKNWFWSIKNSGEVLNKLKCRGFRATSLSTYDFFYSVYNFTT